MVLPSNGMQKEAVVTFPGAIGLMSAQEVKAPLKVIKLEGHLPGDLGDPLHRAFFELRPLRRSRRRHTSRLYVPSNELNNVIHCSAGLKDCRYASFFQSIHVLVR